MASQVGVATRAVRQDASLDELKAENARLRKQLKRTELEREILKSRGILREEVVMKYTWIRFPIALMCELLKVSRSGYYDSIDRPLSRRAERTAKIRQSVRQVLDERHTVYGPAKIAQELQQREELETARRNTCH